MTQLTPSQVLDAAADLIEPDECPTCGSPYPHLHPAVQCEGEVETCVDDFHLTPSPQNRPAYIARVHAKRAALARSEGR